MPGVVSNPSPLPSAFTVHSDAEYELTVGRKTSRSGINDRGIIFRRKASSSILTIRETSCLARPAAHTSAPLRLTSLRRDLPYGGLEMVRNIKEAPLPLHHDDHDPGLQVV